MNNESHRPLTKCDHDRLNRFLDSDDYRIEDEALAAHLDSCPKCRDYIENAAADVDSWKLATSLLQPEEFDQEDGASHSAATLTVLGPRSPVAIQEVLDALSPTDDPHCLGRLGNYEVTGVVGVGGMGVVLKAVDPSLDRIVAIKVMAPRLANNENARKRFSREAKAAAAVLHPNVIPIHSVSSGDTLPYLVMAYVRGGSLQKRINEEGPLQLVEVLRIGSQVAAGLAAAHEQGLVHRDIKPANILLEEGVERVSITDFGLARAVDDNSVTQLGSIAGTPQYMSPEQARGELVDQQSDLFSLGSVLYALCTGRPPFRDETSYGVMRMIIDDSAPSIAELNPQVPAWFVRIVTTLMSKHKQERYGTAREVHELLESCLSHLQQPTVNPLPQELQASHPIFKARNTMKVIVGGFVIMSAMFATIIGLSMHFANQQQEMQEVRAPLSSIDSIVSSMMSTTNELVFLNLGEIGKDSNYLSVKPITGGIVARFPASGMSQWSKRQGKYADRLRITASSLAIPLEEVSEIANDGSVDGVDFLLRIMGDPKSVSKTIKELVVRTFEISDSDECTIAYANMPSPVTTKKGDKPVEVSSSEFVRAFERGTHIYIGEQQNRAFLGPEEIASQEQIVWGSKVMSTDVKTLPEGFLTELRTSQNNSRTRAESQLKVIEEPTDSSQERVCRD